MQLSRTVFPALALLGAGMTLAPIPEAHAGWISVTTTGSAAGANIPGPEGNDCSGFFGQGFNNCQIGDSPVIIKFDVKESGITHEINDTAWPSIDASEFITRFSFETEGQAGLSNGSSGTWTYEPTTGDPIIRFVTIKGGPDWQLYYEIAANPDGVTCANDPLNAACLSAARPLTGGDWVTPNHPNHGRPTGLSHITFWNGGIHGGNGDPVFPEVPEPGSLALLGIGALAGALARRRRQRGAD